MRTVPRARFFFDAGSGGVLWTDSDGDRQRYGHPVEFTLLPVSQALRGGFGRLVEQYDRSLNWDYPPDPGPWREPECARFNQAVRRALRDLRDELGADWVIDDQFQDLHEDPDLDRYLAHPSDFRR
ncbi:MAG: hypothetical protein WCA46_16905 [Actinocatenispora sp.]